MMNQPGPYGSYINYGGGEYIESKYPQETINPPPQSINPAPSMPLSHPVQEANPIETIQTCSQQLRPQIKKLIDIVAQLLAAKDLADEETARTQLRESYQAFQETCTKLHKALKDAQQLDRQLKDVQRNLVTLASELRKGHAFSSTQETTIALRQGRAQMMHITAIKDLLRLVDPNCGPPAPNTKR